jgi:hypothetical protein
VASSVAEVLAPPATPKTIPTKKTTTPKKH